MLNCPQTDTDDDHPILRREVETAVQSLKKGKSVGVHNIPAEPDQAGGEDVITALTTICNTIWQTGEWPTPGTQSSVITLTIQYSTTLLIPYRKLLVCLLAGNIIHAYLYKTSNNIIIYRVIAHVH